MSHPVRTHASLWIIITLFLFAGHARAQEFFSGGGALDIPAGLPGVTSGPANPYPSKTVVAGLKRPIAHITLTLSLYQHSFPGDVGMLLVGPQGQSCVLAGRCGGSVSGQTYSLTFDDDASQNLPGVGFPTGVLRPTNCLLDATDFVAPAPPGPYGSRLGVFNGTNGNGEWRLFVQDFAAQDVGTIEFGWSLRITEAGTPVVVYNSQTALTIPAGAPNITTGPASVYPSNILVTGLTGSITGVGVRLNGLAHTFPADLDILLVGPNQQQCMLMSDAGGGNPGVSFVHMGFAHNATTLVPLTNPLSGGTFLPTDYVLGETMPAPAPLGPYPTSLAVFNGFDPNGYWSLYVSDDSAQDVGSLGYWELILDINQRCPTDFNASGTTDVQDIFDYLSAWFAGCP